MKRLFIILALSVLSFTAVSAQDMETATNLYNEGAMALNDGDKATALQKFEEVLTMTDAIGADAEELANNCKNSIPKIVLAMGKEYAAAKDMDNAISTINKAIEKAKAFGQEDVVNDAKELIPQLYMAEGNAKLNEKDFPGAIAEYKKAIEFDPANGMAYLRLGLASSRTTDEATTVDALTKAAANGQADAANKELGKYYARMAATAYKAKQNDKAYDYGQKAVAAYDGKETLTALSICGKIAMAKKDYKAAITNFESYLAKNPQAKDANSTMYQLAAAFEATGDKAKACGYYKQIVSDPQFAEFAKHKITNELKCN